MRRALRLVQRRMLRDTGGNRGSDRDEDEVYKHESFLHQMFRRIHFQQIQS